MIEHIASLMGLVLAYTIVRRAVKMSRLTARAIRWSMAAQATAALALGLLPWVRPGSFEECVAALVAATLAVQFATARYWSHGVPAQFQDTQPGAPHKLDQPEPVP